VLNSYSSFERGGSFFGDHGSIRSEITPTQRGKPQHELQQSSDHRPQTTDHRPQTTDHRPQTTGHRPQTTGHRPQTTGHRPQTTGHRPQATDHRPQTTPTASEPQHEPQQERANECNRSATQRASTQANHRVQPHTIRNRGLCVDASLLEIKLSLMDTLCV